jgi:hypothetical protein
MRYISTFVFLSLAYAFLVMVTLAEAFAPIQEPRCLAGGVTERSKIVRRFLKDAVPPVFSPTDSAEEAFLCRDPGVGFHSVRCFRVRFLFPSLASLRVFREMFRVRMPDKRRSACQSIIGSAVVNLKRAALMLGQPSLLEERHGYPIKTNGLGTSRVSGWPA